MNVRVVESLSESQVADLGRLYRGEWWTQDRTRDDIREMLAGSSLVIGLVDEDGRLVAFCRVLTDFVFRGTLYDVIADPAHRGEGLGRRLMEAVTEHPRIRRVSSLWLACKPNMPGFYERFGFSEQADELVWMQKRHRAG